MCHVFPACHMFHVSCSVCVACSIYAMCSVCASPWSSRRAPGWHGKGRLPTALGKTQAPPLPTRGTVVPNHLLSAIACLPQKRTLCLSSPWLTRGADDLTCETALQTQGTLELLRAWREAARPVGLCHSGFWKLTHNMPAPSHCNFMVTQHPWCEKARSR